MSKQLYNSGTKWEPIAGYSRAIKVGKTIYISGTTATNESGEIVGKNDPYKQTVQAIENIKKALTHFNANLSHIVRTRMFVTNIDYWESYGKAHGEFFKDIRPATSMIEIKGLIDPDMLIEIEAEAVID